MNSTLRGSDDQWALITDFDGTTGLLALYDRSGDQLSTVDRDVVAGQYRFAAQFEGLIYLAERAADGAGKLRVYFLETGGIVEIAAGAIESREVGIPAPGLVYSVASPEDAAGVWFARAR